MLPAMRPTPRLISAHYLFMKLRDRYPSLQHPALVKALVVRSVYASMALEGQTVPLARLQALYDEHVASTSPAGTAAARRATGTAFPAR